MKAEVSKNKYLKEYRQIELEQTPENQENIYFKTSHIFHKK